MLQGRSLLFILNANGREKTGREENGWSYTFIFTFCRQRQLIIQFEVDLAPIISYCNTDTGESWKEGFTTSTLRRRTV
jgi:hypothetical protein